MHNRQADGTGTEFSYQKSVEIAIVHDIRSIMLINVHSEDRQTDGGRPIKRCHRLDCCQVEEDEFDRLFANIGSDPESIWLGDKPVNEVMLPYHSR